MAHLGIDLGTSNTLVALVTENGTPEIHRIDGAPMVPSMIYLEEQAGNPVVGEAAKDMWADPDYDPAHCYRRWKLGIGENHNMGNAKPGGESGDIIAVTPELLTQYMVEHIIRDISNGLGGEQIESILVTVPHGWRRETPEKCKATRNAASLAKINGIQVTVQDVTVSEPVAAAAYWIWSQEQQQQGAFSGKSILVCDVGGGTFDLSLVKVGGVDKPLDVIDAIHNEYAGDYVDALLCAYVGRQFNQTYHTAYPESAEAVIAAIAKPEMAWLRKWFLTVQEQVKHTYTLRLEKVGLAKMRPVRQKFADPEDRIIEVTIDPPTFEDILKPFYQHGKELVADFLSKIGNKRPDAVIFCGGGSRLQGVQSQIMLPVLTSTFSEKEAQAILGRISVSAGKVDHAIALGAALIANGIVTVQERLLTDVGMSLSIARADLKRELGLPDIPGEQNIYLMPIISKGTPLPASISNEALGLNCTMKHGEKVNIDIVFDNGHGISWVQTWEIPHPISDVSIAERDDMGCSVIWTVEVDADGMLTVVVRSKSGESKKTGTISHPQVSKDVVVINVGGYDRIKTDDFPRITPDQLRKAISEMGRKTEVGSKR